MNFPAQLRLPGPTPVPARVVEAMGAPMINHRGPEFKALLRELEEGLRWAFQTKGDLLVFAASGTGGLESAVANLLSPGERVLAVTIGAFGDRFADLAEAYGAQVQRYAVPWGQAADPEDLDLILAREPDIHSVLLTHNETSTGVTNPVRELAGVIKRHGKLVILDGVSSVGSIDLLVDDWGIDVAITASQKGWMVPPGVTMISVAPAAWERQAQARGPRFYFDWTRARKMQAEGATFSTPAISVLFGLREALAMMREEGLQPIFRRHIRLAAAFRAVVEALNLTILATPDAYSPTVTAVMLPETLHGDAGKQFLRTLREKYNLVVAGGQGPFSGKIFRIGHMGAVTDDDVLATATALERGLADHGQQVRAGAAVAAGRRGLDADAPAMIA